MKLNTAALYSFLSICLILMVLNCSAQFVLTKKGRSQTLNFKFVKNLIILPAMINGKGPFNFVMDTGVSVCLITDPRLKDSLKLKTLRSIKITGFGEGGELVADVSQELSFEFDSNITGNISTAVLQEDAFDLSSYTGMPIHGLIGFDFFNSFVVKINYLAKTMRIYKPATWYIPKKGHSIPISIEGGKPFVNSEIAIEPGKTLKAKLIIDTGAGHPLWLESYEGKSIPLPSKNINANLGIGLSGGIDGFIARIKDFKLGKYTLEDVVTAFPDFNDVGSKVVTQRTGSMGNAVLKKFQVVFNYEKELMFLKPNYTFREAFEHDMSGIELAYQAPLYHRLYIARVEAGSAADEAGLKAKDEITAVNFKSVSEMDIDSIYYLFRSRADKDILLTIIPAGEKKSKFVLLTLKRRI